MSLRREPYPIFKGKCPVCGEEVKLKPEYKLETIRYYVCPNNHVVSVQIKTNKVLSVTIPFNPPKRCPICGYGPCVIEARTRYEVEEGWEEAARLRCPKGHRFSHRQLCFRQYGLPKLPKSYYQ